MNEDLERKANEIKEKIIKKEILPICRDAKEIVIDLEVTYSQYDSHNGTEDKI